MSCVGIYIRYKNVSFADQYYQYSAFPRSPICIMPPAHIWSSLDRKGEHSSKTIGKITAKNCHIHKTVKYEQVLDRSLEVKFSALLGNYRRTNHPTNGQTSLPTDRPISKISIDENMGKQANAADVTDLKGEWVRQRARGDVNARITPHVKIIALVITVFPIDQRNFRFGFSLCAQSIDLSLFVFLRLPFSPKRPASRSGDYKKN